MQPSLQVTLKSFTSVLNLHFAMNAKQEQSSPLQSTLQEQQQQIGLGIGLGLGMPTGNVIPGPETGAGFLVEDGTSFYLIEDGSSFYLQES